MATITITPRGLYSSAPVEHPMIPGWHSVGGARDVPRHDRAAHAAGRAHDCTNIRSAREFMGHTDMPLPEVRRTLAAQYRAHDIRWERWPAP